MFQSKSDTFASWQSDKENEMKEVYGKLVGECMCTTARSSGSGRQNANKVETKVTPMFNISSTASIKKRLESKMQLSEMKSIRRRKIDI